MAAADWWRLWTVLGAAVLVGIVGAVDDIRPLPPLPRLALLLIAMGIAVSALPDGARVLPVLPLAVERLLLVVGGAWFINLTNFMDGMDWLTVVETVPVTAALALFWFFGAVSAPAGLLALALLGATFFFFNFKWTSERFLLGVVGSAVEDLTGPVPIKPGSISIGGLVGYDFGSFKLQGYVTREVAIRAGGWGLGPSYTYGGNNGGEETRGYFRVEIPIYKALMAPISARY